MKIYRIANDLWSSVALYLDEMGIQFDIVDGGLTVNRDSIVAKFPEQDENGAYDELINVLKTKFQKRFYYASKTDDWLFLSVIGG